MFSRSLSIRQSLFRSTTVRSFSTNYFKTLSIDPPTFKLEEKDLHARYKKLMVANHPDKFSGSDEVARLDPKEITNAFRTLKTPHLRADHLLSISGDELGEDNQSEVLPMEFLMEMMEIREELEEIGDTESNEAERAKLENLKDANLNRVNATISVLEDAFDGSDIKLARENTAKLNYYRRIEEEIKEKEAVV